MGVVVGVVVAVVVAVVVGVAVDVNVVVGVVVGVVSVPVVVGVMVVVDVVVMVVVVVCVVKPSSLTCSVPVSIKLIPMMPTVEFTKPHKSIIASTDPPSIRPEYALADTVKCA